MDFLEMRELYHHGIDGQKWGVRNGPPYPLPYSAHTTIEKRKNSKTLLDNYNESKRELKRQYKRAQETEKAKTKLLIKTNKEYDKIDRKNDKEIASKARDVNFKFSIDRAVHDNALTRKIRQILESSVANLEFAKSKKASDERARELENNAIMNMSLEELQARLRG